MERDGHRAEARAGAGEEDAARGRAAQESARGRAARGASDEPRVDGLLEEAARGRAAQESARGRAVGGPGRAAAAEPRLGHPQAEDGWRFGDGYQRLVVDEAEVPQILGAAAREDRGSALDAADAQYSASSRAGSDFQEPAEDGRRVRLSDHEERELEELELRALMRRSRRVEEEERRKADEQARLTEERRRRLEELRAADAEGREVEPPQVVPSVGDLRARWEALATKQGPRTPERQRLEPRLDAALAFTLSLIHI